SCCCCCYKLRLPPHNNADGFATESAAHYARRDDVPRLGDSRNTLFHQGKKFPLS
ncbi:hypothetical protein QTP86_027542, partial [Hemibagrus guttatus]